MNNSIENDSLKSAPGSVKGRDEITLRLDGVSVSGWKSIRITRGIERCPSDFEFDLTELYPGELYGLVVVPGQACTVLAGGDIVLTGYVDRYTPSIDASSHTITVQGRGKCQDLVDCSAEWDGGQIAEKAAFGIATKLAAPYDIEVKQTPGLDTSLRSLVTTFNLILGETAWEIIERVCQNAGVLCYEAADGALMMSHTGARLAAGGLAQGINVQSASYALSADQRYSQYKAFAMNFNSFSTVEEAEANLLITLDDKPLPIQSCPPGVLRHRMHYVIAEGGPGYEEVTKRRAVWEMNRRDGRSQMLHVVTDSWRDADGALYEPNTLIGVDIPLLKVNQQVWLIGEVTYKRDESGTTCELILMPPNAFLPEPQAIANGAFYLPNTVPHAGGK